MKLTRSEFEAQLKLAQSLPAEARKAMITNLKSAEVVEVDKDNKETTVSVEIIDATPETKAVEKLETKAADDTADDERITKAVAKALEDHAKKNPAKSPGIGIVQNRKVPDAAKRIRPKNFKSFDGQETTPGERAYRFGMFRAAVAFGSPKAVAFCEENGIPLTKFTESGEAIHQKDADDFTEFNNATSVLIPEEFDYDIIDLREQYGVLRGLVRVSPMTRDTKTRFRRTGGLTASFVGEQQAGSKSKKTWDAVSLVAKKLMTLSVVSKEYSEDIAGIINLADDLAGEIAYAFAEKEDDCGINGTGTSTYGRITGFLTKLTDVNGVDDGGSLVLAAGNAYSEITLANFHAVIARLPQYADTPGAAWLCHRSFWAGVMQPLATAQGGSPGYEVINGVRQLMFLGYPVKISQKMPSTAANSQVCALLGDYNRAADFGDRRQTTIMFSEHATVDSINVFETDQLAMRGTERFDFNVHDVGDSSTAGPVVGLILAAS